MKQHIKTLTIASIIATLAALGGYVAGHRSAATPSASEPAMNANAKAEPKILFYRNPMGLPDTSPTPKKDSMGMDYLPVYEGDKEPENGSAHQIRISTDKVQKLGVRTEAATMQPLGKAARAVGRVEPDERRIYAIAPKFEGYIERLHVNATGQPVGKGQPLFEAYSPELVSAQREYVIAAKGIDSLSAAGSDSAAAMRQLADSSLARLRNWDVSDEQIKALARSGEPQRLLTYRSPVSGVVTEKKALQGMRFMPGDALYQVADLSSVWIVADVFEQDIAQIKLGSKAQARIDAYPGKIFSGAITYVYPTLNPATRTIPVRMELANPGLLLKPGMFAQLELPASSSTPVLTIPTSAVIDSGVRQIVLVQAKEGRFEPRELKLGARSQDRVEVIDGIREGELVVVSANFLIDAESNLKAAISGFGGAAQGASPNQGAMGSPSAAASAGHHAEGRIEAIDSGSGAVSIAHGPVPSLQWPGMTMQFKLANSALLGSAKRGDRVAFEFVERGQGEWVITSLTPAQAARSNP
jgi:Cu(I)/Ag(I) efflux system membrane fusion protein